MKYPWVWYVRYWHGGWWHKTVVAVIVAVLVLAGGMYSIAEWYVSTQRGKLLVLGTSFIADYAVYLGLDPHQAYTHMLDDLGVKHLRLVSYWSDIETTKGSYNFGELDWEFQQAAAHGAKITLAVGLRQPRWPECHMPDWAGTEATSQWHPELSKFIASVVNRYKLNPSLESYQLENEYFLHEFGTCPPADRAQLTKEAALVKSLDHSHPLIITRSNNIVGWEVGPPLPDEYGMSIYRRVWSTPIGRYLQYPFPDWYYAFMAGMEKISTGRDTFIHEIETEPWVPDGNSILTTSLAEQSYTMDAAKFKDTVTFAEHTGMTPIYLWGTEYWYYRMTVLHDPSLWQAAKDAYKQ